MIAYIGLGSNLGDRKDYLLKAVQFLQELSPLPLKLSRIYENPALMPEAYDDSFNKTFLNMVVELNYQNTAEKLLSELQLIEQKLGRKRSKKWAPRSIDLDLLIFGDLELTTPKLKLPHPELKNRNFVLAPLRDLTPNTPVSYDKSATCLSLNRSLKTPLPCLMQIVNLSDESFSDGGLIKKPQDLKGIIENIDNYNIGIIDIGAESTRPNATAISSENEISKLSQFLPNLKEFYQRHSLSPLISIDTRHAQTMAWASKQEVDIINDVSGKLCDNKLQILNESSCDYVLTHSLSAPVNPKEHIPIDKKADDVLLRWFEEQLNNLQKYISLDRVIIDPGIGFGKTPNQNWYLLKHIKKLQQLPVRILVGHSRKSFLQTITDKPAADRDLESIGLSIELASQGVDILRLHNAHWHHRSLVANCQIK